MSEPKAIAATIETVVPGVWRWSVQDDRIGYESDAHAIAAGDRIVLIDPLRVETAILERLGPVEAICLTAACHQRAAWHYRRRLGVKVYAPDGTRPMDEEPDLRYRAGDVLPGGLRAIHTPGPETAHYAFLSPQPPGILFCPDLLSHGAGDVLAFVPAEYHENPALTRQSVRNLLDLDFAVLCFDHGRPLLDEPKAALRALLAEKPGTSHS
jgi:glyoxylase-like metal-dependent hydrolase (beta-lactamase superfamily II)